MQSMISGVSQLEEAHPAGGTDPQVSSPKPAGFDPARLAAIVNSSDDAIIGKTLDGVITDWNPGSERLYGYPASEVIGSSMSMLIPTNRPTELRDILGRVARGERIEHYETVRVRKDGSLVEVSISTSPIKDARGTIVGAATIARDITARKQAEGAQASVAAQLDAANKELEAFTYSVSHDLRAPLRSIDGFSLALLEDCADQLDEAGKGYLDRIRAATGRMAKLIDDLLKLSRLTRGQLQVEPVDLSALAHQIAGELQEADPTRHETFAIADGLEVAGDPVLLRAALENLLGNAWKFTRHNPAAHISFSAGQVDGVTVYSVQDDGVGFDMAYADKLFGAFQRLHTTEEFEGTGIGLATVQRIVHRHGGRIWADAVVGKGATFRFTLAPS